LARFGQSFKDRAVARLLPPESATLEKVCKEVGITVNTLERWRENVQSMPARGRAWTAPAKLQAVITTASLSEVDKNAWCREHGIYPAELEQWCSSATIALADPQGARSSPQVAIKDRKRIKDLERELMRKDRALAETAALLVLSKKVAAIYNWGEDA
jgi:transposase